MQQIADWLKKLGMPEYGERFAENGIDVSVLPLLASGSKPARRWWMRAARSTAMSPTSPRGVPGNR
jgi:hypothetical protein